MCAEAGCRLSSCAAAARFCTHLLQSAAQLPRRQCLPHTCLPLAAQSQCQRCHQHLVCATSTEHLGSVGDASGGAGSSSIQQQYPACAHSVPTRRLPCRARVLKSTSPYWHAAHESTIMTCRHNSKADPECLGLDVCIAIGMQAVLVLCEQRQGCQGEVKASARPLAAWPCWRANHGPVSG